jgi:hypothetical protein
MKYVSIRIPDAGPLGETFRDASARAIAGAFFVKRPAGGYVASVLTVATHSFFLALAMLPPRAMLEMQPDQVTPHGATRGLRDPAAR